MISDQIGFDLLRTFVAVCRLSSMSRFAAQSGRTQSAVSMQMRRLEELTGQRLFQRTGRGVAPTTEGEVLLAYANRILALADEAHARLSQAEVSGGVRIGLAEQVAHTALPVALGRLNRAFPDIRLDVTVDNSVALGRLFGEGALDVMIGPVAVAVGDALTTWNVELQWVSAPDFVPAPGQVLDLVAFTAPCLWRQRMLDALSDADRGHRVVFSSRSIMALQIAVESGLGVGLLPPEAVRHGAMRTLTHAHGMPTPPTVQYGLYARDARLRVAEVAISALIEALPAVRSSLVPDTRPYDRKQL